MAEFDGNDGFWFSGWDGPDAQEISEMMEALIITGYVEVIGVNEDGEFLFGATEKARTTSDEQQTKDLKEYYNEHLA